MTEINCGYAGDRDETLVAYLYDDIDPAERAAFERASGDVRAVPRRARRRSAACAPAGALGAAAPSMRPSAPAVAAAAAALVARHPRLGAGGRGAARSWASRPASRTSTSATTANGLTMRTGWSKAPAPLAAARRARRRPRPPATPRRGAPISTALEQQLRTELHAVAGRGDRRRPPVARPASAQSDADVLRRVRALIEESERRQQRELALRVAQVMRDVDAQRRADLVKIDQSLGAALRTTRASK